MLLTRWLCWLSLALGQKMFGSFQIALVDLLFLRIILALVIRRGQLALVVRNESRRPQQGRHDLLIVFF